VAPRNPRNAHRPLDAKQRLEEILSVRVARQWRTIIPSAGMELAGACHAKKCVPVFGVRRWKLNAGWMVRIGYASAAGISACAIAQRPCNHPQALPAYGLQGSRNKSPKPKHKIKSKYHVPTHHPWKRKPWKRTFLLGRKPDHFYFALTALQGRAARLSTIVGNQPH